MDNEIEGLPDYFKTVFGMFPRLITLDNKNKDGKEVDPVTELEENESFSDDDDEIAEDEPAPEDDEN
jgi:hypothetical protein